MLPALAFPPDSARLDLRWGSAGWRRHWWLLPVCNRCKHLGCERCAGVSQTIALTGDDTCPIHGVALIEEPGGPDQPTIYGRTYCPECQRDLMAALDEHP